MHIAPSAQPTVLTAPLYPLQGRQSMQNGVGVATELEEDVDPIEARTFLEHPDKLLQLQNSAIMESVRK